MRSPLCDALLKDRHWQRFRRRVVADTYAGCAHQRSPHDALDENILNFAGEALAGTKLRIDPATRYCRLFGVGRQEGARRFEDEAASRAEKEHAHRQGLASSSQSPDASPHPSPHPTPRTRPSPPAPNVSPPSASSSPKPSPRRSRHAVLAAESLAPRPPPPSQCADGAPPSSLREFAMPSMLLPRLVPPPNRDTSSQGPDYVRISPRGGLSPRQVRKSPRFSQRATGHPRPSDVEAPSPRAEVEPLPKLVEITTSGAYSVAMSVI